MVSPALALLPLAVGTLALGMGIYHSAEGLAWPGRISQCSNASWRDGTGRSITYDNRQVGGWFYALFAGVVFLVLAGVMLSPVIHHVLQRFHLEREGKHAEKKMTALIERRAYCLLPGDRPRRAELKID